MSARSPRLVVTRLDMPPAIAIDDMTTAQREVHDRLKGLMVGYFPSSPSEPRLLEPEVECRLGSQDDLSRPRRPHPQYPRNRRRHTLVWQLSTDFDRVAQAWSDVGTDCVDDIVITSATAARSIDGRNVWLVSGIRQCNTKTGSRHVVRSRDGSLVATPTWKGLGPALRRYEGACGEDWKVARIVFWRYSGRSDDQGCATPVEFEMTSVRASADGITVVGRHPTRLDRAEMRVVRAEDGLWLDATSLGGYRRSPNVDAFLEWKRQQDEVEAAANAMSAEDEEALACLD